MMEVTVKTLDGKNRKYEVPDDRTVKQFKDKIANSIGIPADSQRLIFRGKVLQDEKKLSEYEVDGQVIHVVQRLQPGTRPPGSSASADGASTSAAGPSGARGSTPPGGNGPDAANYVLGSFTLPTDLMDPNQVQNVVQNAIAGMGDVGRNARISTRPAPDGSSVDVHIHLGQIAMPQVVSASQRRLSQLRHMLHHANRTLDRLENPPRGTSSRTQGTSSQDASPERETPSTPPSDMEADGEVEVDVEVDIETVEAETVGMEDVMETETSGNGSETQTEGATGGSQTASTSTSTTTEAGTSTRAATADASTDTSAPPTATSGTQTPSNAPPPVRHPPITRLGDMLGDVFTLQRRLQPHLERFQRLMQDDPAVSQDAKVNRQNQRLFNLVTEALHYVSHAYHLVSDLMVDMNQPTPRVLRAPPMAIPGPIQQHSIGIPIAVSMPMPGMPGSAPGTAPTAQAQATAPTTSATPGTPATAATPGGAPQPGMPGAPPYMFMEVGPNAVTLNSISTHVVTAGTATPAQDAPTSNTSPAATPAASAPTAPPAPAGAPRPPAVQQGGVRFSQTAPNVFQMHIPPGGRMPGFPGMPAGMQPGQNRAQIRIAGQPGQPGQMQFRPGPPGAQPGTMFFGGPGGMGAMHISTTPGFAAPGAPGAAGGLPPFLSPDVLGNLIQSAAQHAMQHAGQAMPGGVPQQAAPAATSSATTSSPSSTAAPSASTPASSAGTTPAASTAPGAGMPAGININNNIPGLPPGIPMMPGIPGMPGRHHHHVHRPVDPFLPCQSRHFLTRRAAQAARRAQTAPAPGAAATSQPSSQASPQAAPPQAAGLASMVSNLVGSLMGGQGLQGGFGPVASTASTSTTSSTGSPRPANPFAQLFAPRPGAPAQPGAPRAAAPQGATPRPGAPQSQQFMDMMRQVLSQGAGQQPSQSGTSARTAPAASSSSGQASSSVSSGNQNSSSSGGEFSDEMFAQLVHGVCNYVAQAATGGQSTETMADFLNNMSSTYSIPQGEGLLTDIFNCVARALTFPDFMAVFYGNAAPLQRLRQPLQDLIREKILEDAEPTQGNVNQAVERLMSDLDPEIEAACVNQRGREDINLRSTYREFIRQQLTITIRLIMNAEEGDAAFGTNLHARIKNLIYEFVALSIHILDGGDAALHSMMEGRMRAVAHEANPVIQQWMVGIARQELNQLIPRVNIEAFSLERYIVRGAVMEVEPCANATPAPTAAALDAAQSDAAQSDAAQSDAEQMETSGGASPTSDASMEVNEDRSRLHTPEPGFPNIPADLLSALPPPPIPQPRDNNPESTADDSWHQVVPREWVPVIIRDVNRQRRQPPQGPVSDAYVSGMPAKRRKLMDGKRDHDASITQAESIPDAIRQAARLANVEPITSLQAIKEDVEKNTDLQNAFEQEISTVLSERISEDSDYVPQKYPNSENVFKSKKPK